MTSVYVIYSKDDNGNVEIIEIISYLSTLQRIIDDKIKEYSKKDNSLYLYDVIDINYSYSKLNNLLNDNIKIIKEKLCNEIEHFDKNYYIINSFEEDILAVCINKDWHCHFQIRENYIYVIVYKDSLRQFELKINEVEELMRLLK